MKNIGIVGRGFVGEAVDFGFSSDKSTNYKIRIYDKNKNLSTHSLDETVNKSDVLFISVPTPSNVDGSINIDTLTNCLCEINNINRNDAIILIRSTVIPGTSQAFANKFPKLKIVFNPEFLTEKNAKEDFINLSRVILGGNKNLTNEISLLYKTRFGNSIKIIETNYQTAELIKYMSNCFLATKVSFVNEMKILSNHVNANWDDLISGFTSDERIGSSHVNVPGHDGKLGFGGSCFPKDMKALISFSEDLNIDLNVVKGAWKTNLDVRPEKDWEKLKGRSVVD